MKEITWMIPSFQVNIDNKNQLSPFDTWQTQTLGLKCIVSIFIETKHASKKFFHLFFYLLDVNFCANQKTEWHYGLIVIKKKIIDNFHDNIFAKNYKKKPKNLVYTINV